jgi:hypothetical protein
MRRSGANEAAGDDKRSSAIGKRQEEWRNDY